MIKDDYNSFITLPREERMFMLIDRGFRDYLLSYQTNSATLSEIISSLSVEEAHVLYDEGLFSALSDSSQRNIMTDRLSLSLSPAVKKEFGKSPALRFWLKSPRFTGNLFNQFDENDRMLILSECFLDSDFSDSILIMSRDIYPEPNQEIEKKRKVDYQKNALINQLMDSFVNGEPYKSGEVELLKGHSVMLTSLRNRDGRVAKKYLNDMALLATLDRYTIKNLYAELSFSDLSKEEQQVVFDALYANVQIELPKTILFDKEFIDRIVGEEDLATYKTYVENLQFYNPSVVETIKQARQSLYNQGLADAEVSDFSQANDPDSKFMEIFFDRFFEASQKDCFLTACVLKDALGTKNSRDQSDKKENLKGMRSYVNKLIKEDPEIADLVEAIEILANWFEYKVDVCTSTASKDRTKKPNINANNTSKDMINDSEYLARLYPLMKRQKNSAQNFAKLFNKARELFEQDLSMNLFEPYSFNPKNEKLIDRDFFHDVRVWDIRDLDEYYLLVHAGKIKNSNVKDKKYHTISMSLLDKNHHGTYGDIHEIIYGYSFLPPKNILHAYMKDSFTICSNAINTATKKPQMLTDFVPTYLNLPDFMKGTEFYNEIKVRAFGNSVDSEGNEIMKPSYILCFNTITKKAHDEAKRYGIPIVFTIENTKMHPTDSSASTVERLARKSALPDEYFRFDHGSKFSIPPDPPEITLNF